MNKFWTASYPEGVKTEVASEHKSLTVFFDEVLARYADRQFSSNMGVSYSYAQIDQLAKKISAWLQQQDLPVGATIGLMMPNVHQYMPIVIGIIRAGYILTTINPLYTPRELKYQLLDAEVSAIFILEPFCGVLAEVIAETNIQRVVISKIGDMLGTAKGSVVNLAAKYVKKAVPNHSLKSSKKYKVTAFKALLKQANTQQYIRPVQRPTDLAMLQYTGGTTGVAKGILINHDNVIVATAQFEQWFIPVYQKLPQDSQTNTIIALPLYHIYAFIILLMGMRVGQHFTLVTNPRDIDGFVKILSKRPFHILPAVNTLYQALLQHPKFAKLDFSSLVLSLAGGMAATQATANKWHQVTGLPIIEGWGMSEGLGVGTANPLSNEQFNGNIGLPLPGVDISIRDDEERELAVGEVGEMCIKGPNIISGYHNIDNSPYFTYDGYLKTGDIAAMDENGYIQIYDRKKDMLIVSGFNVFPNEVEGVIEMHVGVAECAVVGVDDELQGQQVKAYVVRTDPKLTEAQLKDFCKQSLTGYKRPKHIEFVSELPKSTVGKILRHELRANANRTE